MEVFGRDGRVLFQVLPDTFKYPRTLFSDPQGSIMVVSDWTANKVVIATSEGKALFLLMNICGGTLATKTVLITLDLQKNDRLSLNH